MARPKTASDEAILQAAHRVFVRRGYDGFTLSEVAREVGISRAAIIQRFESTHALKMTLTRSMVDQFCKLMDSLPVSRDGDALVSLTAFIGQMVADRQQLGFFMQNLAADMNDEALAKLEAERGRALYTAIAVRMPELTLPHESAVKLFAAHLGGALMQWQLEPEHIDARTYLVERTRAWLDLAGVRYSAEVMEYPHSEALEATAETAIQKVSR